MSGTRCGTVIGPDGHTRVNAGGNAENFQICDRGQLMTDRTPANWGSTAAPRPAQTDQGVIVTHPRRMGTMSLFGRKRHTNLPASAPAPKQVPPFGSIVQPLQDVTVPGRGVVATPRTPGRVVMDTAGVLSPDSVFVEWYGGVTTDIRVDALQPQRFEPARDQPPQQQQRSAATAQPTRRRSATRTVQYIRDEPIDPNGPHPTDLGVRINPDGSRTETVIIRDEPSNEATDRA